MWLNMHGFTRIVPSFLPVLRVISGHLQADWHHQYLFRIPSGNQTWHARKSTSSMDNTPSKGSILITFQDLWLFLFPWSFLLVSRKFLSRTALLAFRTGAPMCAIGILCHCQTCRCTKDSMSVRWITKTQSHIASKMNPIWYNVMYRV